MEALVFDRVGPLREVLALRAVDPPAVPDGHVLLEVSSSPVHPADVSFVQGTYRVRPAFPQIAGLSGAGTVVRAATTAGLAVGAHVAFRWPGAWAQRIAVPVARTYRVPPGIAVDDAAQFPVNPVTAWGLLAMAEAPSGGFIAVTAATSSMAAVLLPLAHARGLQVIGIVRRGSRAPASADVTFNDDEPSLAEHVRVCTNGAGLASLIDCVGGSVVTALLPTLMQGGTVVTYGVLGEEPAAVTNRTIVYGNLTWRGFGLDRWLASLPPESHVRMLDELWTAMAHGRLPLPVAQRAPLAAFREVLGDGTKGSGKLVFTPR